MNRQEIERYAEETLRRIDIFSIPIAIDVVAHRLKLAIEAASLGKDISGVLVVENGLGAIAYNVDDAPVRQRFTIAHEIAHYLLHVQTNRRSQLFIDRYVAYRNDIISSTGKDQDEVEANRLGAALLMPESLLRAQIKHQMLDLVDDEAIAMLAKQFQVSAVAMTNRLSNLDLLW